LTRQEELIDSSYIVIRCSSVCVLYVTVILAAET